jgi:tRNA dimethylallyltransferase
MKKTKPKIVVILGPTASGKSDLAVSLAKKYNGEIISADSRQVYKGLDIGTGKITKKEMRGVPHHLLDISKPKQTFTAHDFKALAEKKIQEISERGKVPIIVGGTGFYIQTLVDNIIIPDVPPNPELRKELHKKTIKELFLILAELDLRRAATIDANNPRRMIRAIEIAKAVGAVPEIKKERKYDSLQIGIDWGDIELKERIYKRLHSRLRKGMVAEIKNLHKKGLSWRRMEELGLEYRYISRFVRGKITKQEMIEQLSFEIWHYAKRQRTWFKHDETIHWFLLSQTHDIEKTVEEFLGKLK